MPPPRVTVVIPTLNAGRTLWECVESLQRQTYSAFRIVIVDNSGKRLVETNWPETAPREGVQTIFPAENTGFGAAVNLGARLEPAEYYAVINDDAAAEPEWISELVRTMEEHRDAGSAASQVRIHGVPDRLDSAGMLIAADGTSKQRGQGEPPSAFATAAEVLLTSGSAAIYRHEMFQQTGGFDGSFFLYCEDTDLGLRARWAGWTCRYVPTAVVHHHYSASAGRASSLKAYFVERNRLLTVLKNFPIGDLLLTPLATPVRYWHHFRAMRRGSGAAAQFRKDGQTTLDLAKCILRAYWDALRLLPGTLAARRHIRSTASISTAEFRAALRRHRISLKQVAAL